MACNALEPCQLKWSVFLPIHTFLIQFCQLGRRTTSKIPMKLISSMDPRHVSLLIQLLSVVQGFNNPLVDTRVYDKDYSVFLLSITSKVSSSPKALGNQVAFLRRWRKVSSPAPQLALTSSGRTPLATQLCLFKKPKSVISGIQH